jgi:hypothetical protein
VAELKRDEARDVHLQAVNYAALLSRFDRPQRGRHSVGVAAMILLIRAAMAPRALFSADKPLNDTVAAAPEVIGCCSDRWNPPAWRMPPRRLRTSQSTGVVPNMSTRRPTS